MIDEREQLELPTSLSSTFVEVISVSGRRRQHWSSLIVAVPSGAALAIVSATVERSTA
jgi:hypothetical protein